MSMKREANFNTTFNHWIKEVYKKTGAFELKQTQGDSLPFSDVKAHQIAALEASKWGCLVYKIPDVGYQNPFDCFSLSNVPSYVVIYYQKHHFFCLVDVETFVLESQRNSKKSLSYSRAKDIAQTVIPM
jgi:hypothetical protein